MNFINPPSIRHGLLVAEINRRHDPMAGGAGIRSIVVENNTRLTLASIDASGIPVVHQCKFSPTSDKLRITVRYRFGSSEQVRETKKYLDSIRNGLQYLSPTVRILKDRLEELIDSADGYGNEDLYVIDIIYDFEEEDIVGHNGSFRLPELNLSFVRQINGKFVDYVPGTYDPTLRMYKAADYISEMFDAEAPGYEAASIERIRTLSMFSGSFITVVDNNSLHRGYWFTSFGDVVQIEPVKDTALPEGVYRIRKNHRDTCPSKGTAYGVDYFTFEQAKSELGMSSTREDALKGGETERERKQQEKERHEGLQLQSEGQKMKADLVSNVLKISGSAITFLSTLFAIFTRIFF